MNNRPSRSKTRSSRSRNERGITLVTTLLLLLLLIGMSLTMVLAVSSESLINGFYGRYRGSFYAADSGVAASRQQLMNLLGANVTAGFNPAASPIANPTTAGANAALALTTSYSGYTNVNSAGSWQERFLVKQAFVAQTPNTLAATCTVQGGTTGATCAAPTQTTSSPITAYVYSFPYTTTIVGQSQGSEVATITDSGTIIVTAPTSPPTYNQSFAAWGMFIGTYALCSADLVPGTITGPVFTNGSWNFITPVPTPLPTRSARWAARPDGIMAAVKPPRLRRTASSRRSTAASTFLKTRLHFRRTRLTRNKQCSTESAYHRAQLVRRILTAPPPTLGTPLAQPIRRLERPAPAYIFLIRLPAPRP